jgi:hypothetical protein
VEAGVGDEELMEEPAGEEEEGEEAEGDAEGERGVPAVEKDQAGGQENQGSEDEAEPGERRVGKDRRSLRWLHDLGMVKEGRVKVNRAEKGV